MSLEKEVIKSIDELIKLNINKIEILKKHKLGLIQHFKKSKQNQNNKNT